MDFIHLHNHSDNSILDGAITVEKMIKKAVDLGMPAIALTDHGNMFGGIEFYQKAKKAGITPIIGEEFYMAPDSRLNREYNRNSGDEVAHHLLLLAKNEEGYKNLMKLSSIGYTEGFYYKPRIDMEVLEKYSDGLICGSACLGGQIPSFILKGKFNEARELSGRFREIFGRDNFYLEMQDHQIPEQVTVNKELVKIATELDIHLIATNDAHYVDKEDAYSHEVLLCIQTGKIMKDRDRMKFQTDEFYLKSAEQMGILFRDYPDAIFNTYKIYEMIDLELDLGKTILPHFEVPDGYDLNTYLKYLVYEGAKKRYGQIIPETVSKRIDYELSVILNMNFSGYFLIVWDVMNFARETGVPAGPGRGSAAGSIVSYCLGITALDPLKYDLLFERFLNPDRNEMPDMDLDFCANRREEVIEYVRSKYGNDHVSQIITFNKMKAKGVVRDVARAMDIPYSRANEISKLIEEDTLQGSLKSSKELRDLCNREEAGKELVEISLKLEGLIRSAGKHAAGIVISREVLTDYVPLYKDKDGSISSQYEKDTLEKAGLVKMDFLGLKNLTIIDKCLKLIKESRNVEIDIDSLSLDDDETFKLLQQANTKGIFQLEKSGAQNLLRSIKPTVFEDIIAINALNRPGPIKSGMANDFILRKRNSDMITYPDESLESILKDTLGVVVYQEQVMLISQVMGGFSLPEADKLRKAMGKKIVEIVNDLEEKFLDGAEKKNISRKVAQGVYENIGKFAEYGFNKSHSAAYALIAYQTAYLKAHYPLEFMATLLSAQPDDKVGIAQYINDCRNAGIKVLPPCINMSRFDFTIEGDSIRFGLGAIKGVGSKAVDTIITTRDDIGPFKSLRDFLENVDSLTVNKGVLESFIKSGAMDKLNPDRAKLFASVEVLVDAARRLQEDKMSGQGNLFGGENGADDDVSIELLNVGEWHDNEKLGYEKEVIGLYISGHPLGKYEKDIRMFSSVSISSISEEHNGKTLSIVGMLTNIQFKRSQKSGVKYVLADLEDLEGSLEIIFFSKVLKKDEQFIKSGHPVMITGVIEAENSMMKLIVTGIKTLKDVRRNAISAVHIKIDDIGVDDHTLKAMEDIFVRHKGDCPIYFHVNLKKGEKIVKAHSSFNIKPSENLVNDLSQIIGKESIGYSISQH